MSDWRSGYVEGIGYTYGHYPELNPLRIKLAFLNSGLAAPEIATACELGFGQGVSININAAASPIKWYGTDFDPSQAGHARELARISGSGAQLFDQAFAEFAARPDLPDFDFIGLHGIWSWIDDTNRAIIVDFIRRKLKVGGVVYASYNTLPGWSPFIPMRHLMAQHVARMAPPGSNVADRIDGAIEFAQKLLATNPRYDRPELGLGERLKRMKDTSHHYLAHEYFNQHWVPMQFSDIAELMGSAKLEFACSANYLDNIDKINLTEPQIALLAEIPDVGMREDVRDFMLNRQFRWDYWVKGARQLSMLERVEEFRKLRVTMLSAVPAEPLKIKVPIGEVMLEPSSYAPVLEALSDLKPKTVAQLERQLGPGGVSIIKLMETITLLVAQRIITQVQDDATIGAAWPMTEKLNTHIIAKSRSNAFVENLASPVMGSGMPVSRTEQFFLLARDRGAETASELAEFAWKILDTNGQKGMKGGNVLETAEENIAELTTLAEVFLDKRLSLLEALQIA